MEKDKDTIGHLESTLSEPEMTAIEMKYEGYNYKEMEKALMDIPYKTIRVWFSRSGKLYDFYKSYALEESKKRKAEAHDTFKAHLNNAVRTLVNVMNNSKIDVARVQAAKEIINRQLGEPVKPLSVVDEGKVNEYIEAIQKLDELNAVQPINTPRENTGNETSTG